MTSGSGATNGLSFDVRVNGAGVIKKLVGTFNFPATESTPSGTATVTACGVWIDPTAAIKALRDELLQRYPLEGTQND